MIRRMPGASQLLLHALAKASADRPQVCRALVVHQRFLLDTSSSGAGDNDARAGTGAVQAFAPFARRLFRLITKHDDAASTKAVVAASLLVRNLMAAKEGRSLFIQVGAGAECIRSMRGWLVSRRCHRADCAELLLHTLKLLITASAHPEIQSAILQAPDFNTWIREMIELFTRAREAETKAFTAAPTPVAGKHLRATAQPSRRYPGRAVTHRPGGGDSLARADVREHTALLLRNLALHRGNKNMIVATDGNLKFLLGELVSESLKVVAACSAALWVVLHHCSRAKSALLRLGARAQVRAASRRVEEWQASSAAPAFAGLPSLERTVRHLAMVGALLD
uniref:Uncharacterized protein n=1 Tax=Rhizochromulina marina TaxID=1034831 RepID=A0A7S2RFK7_9STRA